MLRMKTKLPHSFAKLPRTYEALCNLYLPRPIHDSVEYENAIEIVEAFAGFEEKMNADQNDYFSILGTLIAEYDEDEESNATGLELLNHLLKDRDLGGADLSRILGASRTLGPMILRGERALTLDHARTLGKHFGVPAGAFV